MGAGSGIEAVAGVQPDLVGGDTAEVKVYKEVVRS